MQQVVHHAQAAARWAVKAGQCVERAREEDLVPMRVDQAQHERAAAADEGAGGWLRQPVLRCDAQGARCYC
ncbi:MAG TPA: hypothetical protein VN969_33860 [Streptosporangiaceae bacterium]|nr:hypothetical protein [Streptosporangiaceae bacterium]